MPIPENIEDVYKKATCLYTKEQVNEALDRMAAQISEVLADTNPIILCVMIGGLIPLGNLLPRLDFPLEVDYVHATRYQGTTSGGTLSWRVKPGIDLRDRTVLIVDDILDRGTTLSAILDFCRSQKAKAVYSAVLVDKQLDRSNVGVQSSDFVGLAVENHYIFGYGMDYHEYLRNAPGIYKVAPEHE